MNLFVRCYHCLTPLYKPRNFDNYFHKSTGPSLDPQHPHSDCPWIVLETLDQFDELRWYKALE